MAGCCYRKLKPRGGCFIFYFFIFFVLSASTPLHPSHSMDRPKGILAMLFVLLLGSLRNQARAEGEKKSRCLPSKPAKSTIRQATHNIKHHARSHASCIMQHAHKNLCSRSSNKIISRYEFTTRPANRIGQLPPPPRGHTRLQSSSPRLGIRGTVVVVAVVIRDEESTATSAPTTADGHVVERLPSVVVLSPIPRIGIEVRQFGYLFHRRCRDVPAGDLPCPERMRCRYRVGHRDMRRRHRHFRDRVEFEEQD